MLIEFTVENYRSFRDEAVLSMEATGANQFKWHSILYRLQLFPGVLDFSVLAK
mgnify:CR=1 FL=1